MIKNGVHNKVRIRRNVQIAFVKEFAHLFKEAGRGPLKTQGHTSEAGRLVVEKARKLIGYSSTYGNMDIYRNLYHLYRVIFNL